MLFGKQDRWALRHGLGRKRDGPKDSTCPKPVVDGNRNTQLAIILDQLGDFVTNSGFKRGLLILDVADGGDLGSIDIDISVVVDSVEIQIGLPAAPGGIDQ